MALFSNTPACQPGTPCGDIGLLFQNVPEYSAFKVPPAIAPPGAPQTLNQLLGNWTTEQAAVASDVQTQTQNIQFFTALANSINANGQGTGSYNWWLIGGAALAVLVIGKMAFK